MNCSFWFFLALLSTSMTGCESRDGSSPLNDNRDDFEVGDSSTASINVMVFSRTQGFRHASIASGREALRQMAEDGGWYLKATESIDAFLELGNYDVVVWLNTTGDVLDPTQQQSFEDFIRQGGGYVGIHSASDTEAEWSWYGDLVGAYFANHPAVQPARLVVEDRDHPSTEHLSDEWRRTDEWYNFDVNPREQVQVLLAIDESSYSGGAMGDHPMAWYHEFDGGRAFYTALGHTEQSYLESDFLEHLHGAILWAAKAL